MGELTEEVLDRIEREHPDGLSSVDIVALLESHNVKFTEASLRKYVQLGLLPRSHRVGRKGKHRGSQGMYPPSIVRQILEIKKLLAENHTIDELRQDFFLLRGELEELEQKLKRLFDGVETTIKTRYEGPGTGATSMARRELKEARELGEQLLTRLRAVEARLAGRTLTVAEVAPPARNAG